MTRDVRIIHRRLIAEGRAVWLGETFPEGRAPPPLDDVARAVAGVKALFEQPIPAESEPTPSSSAVTATRPVDPQAEAAAS
jgi:hypothetical protein